MKTYTCPVCDVLCPNRKNCIDNCRKNMNSCISVLRKLEISKQEIVSEQDGCWRDKYKNLYRRSETPKKFYDFNF